MTDILGNKVYKTFASLQKVMLDGTWVFDSGFVIQALSDSCLPRRCFAGGIKADHICEKDGIGGRSYQSPPALNTQMFSSFYPNN